MVVVRRLFVEAMQEKDGVRFVFVGETSTNLTCRRRHGRATAGAWTKPCRCTTAQA